MRKPESFIGQPIRSLQTMLRVIAENDAVHETVIPDGIYGPETLSAVSTFQRLHGLPVTGVTDNRTWDAVVEIYESALVEQQEACLGRIIGVAARVAITPELYKLRNLV